MNPLLCVSPHYDDAGLSCGQFLASWPGAHTLTVFGGVPNPKQTTSFDHHSGFADSTQAIISRTHEDDRALRTLRSRPLRAAYLDNQYRIDLGIEPPSVAEIADLIVRTAEAINALRIVGPLGLAHIDHEICGAALREVAHARPSWDVWAYEEIPLRVEHPEVVPLALKAAGITDARAREFLGEGDITIKERAVRCYRSQLWAISERMCYVPERFWRIGA